MNPKGAQNLDPKLKETYERVMGTNFPSSPAANQTPSLQQPQKTENTAPSPTLKVEEVTPEPAFVPKVESVSNEMVQSPDFSAKSPFLDPLPPPPDILAKNTTANVDPTTPKKGNKLKPVLIGFLGLLFFAAYAVTWAKIFSLF